ncbi:ParB-like nuclease domain-containing protein [Shimia gijangensis]|uniref:ParB-like nuclease domain-containing protein n=1 Tax=Shimia gijangensis TaxID=1470563 RepID=A0A1M6UFK3_9RHOB|nr:ParB N-terminal domain-containing protein [Shimia gijangensis]SHK67923.1 ParB-like nuclease domain-containing protein [Shimia gijangensis]
MRPELERVAPQDLKPSPRNARTHDKKQIRQIADSIEAFGFTNPLLIKLRAFNLMHTRPRKSSSSILAV